MWQNTVVPGRTHNNVHALRMLNNWGWGHALRISIIYCFSTATIVTRMLFSVTLCAHCRSALNLLCFSRRLHPDLFCNFTDLHFGLFLQRVWKNDIFTNRKFLLDQFQNEFDWIQFKIMCRSRSAQKPLCLSNHSTFHPISGLFLLTSTNSSF